MRAARTRTGMLPRCEARKQDGSRCRQQAPWMIKTRIGAQIREYVVCGRHNNVLFCPHPSVKGRKSKETMAPIF